MASLDPSDIGPTKPEQPIRESNNPPNTITKTTRPASARSSIHHDDNDSDDEPIRKRIKLSIFVGNSSKPEELLDKPLNELNVQRPTAPLTTAASISEQKSHNSEQSSAPTRQPQNLVINRAPTVPVEVYRFVSSQGTFQVLEFIELTASEMATTRRLFSAVLTKTKTDDRERLNLLKLLATESDNTAQREILNMGRFTTYTQKVLAAENSEDREVDPEVRGKVLQFVIHVASERSHIVQLLGYGDFVVSDGIRSKYVRRQEDNAVKRLA